MPGVTGTPEDRDVFSSRARDPEARAGSAVPAGRLDARHARAAHLHGRLWRTGRRAFPIPADLKQAVLTLAIDWYYLQTRQAEPVISRSAGAETVTYVNEALPRRFPMLINAYRRW